MTFSIAQLIQERQDEQYSLHRQYINPSMARVLGIIGFDKIYARGEGAYLWDVEGDRYLDLLSGYSVFNLGRGHPVVKQVMQETLALERPTLVKMDCPLLPGLLAEGAAADFVAERLSGLGLPVEWQTFRAVASQNAFPMAINLMALLEELDREEECARS